MDAGRRNIVIGGVALFACALLLFTGVGLFVTSAATSLWNVVFRASSTGPARQVRLSTLREWHDLAAEPPALLAALDGEVASFVGWCRPEADGIWLVERGTQVISERPPSVNRAVWVDVPEEYRGRLAALRGKKVRVEGTMRVGVASIGEGRTAAWRIEPGVVFVYTGQIHQHDHEHNHHGHDH